MAINLDSEASALDAQAPPIAWDPKDPAKTSNFSTTTTVYDGLGNAHSVDIYFRKKADAPGSWEWHALISKADVVGAAAAATDPEPFQELGTGTMTFDLATTPDADRATTAKADLKNAGTINPYNDAALAANGLALDKDGKTLVIDKDMAATLANGSTINFRFALGERERVAVTQFAADSATTFMSQDGYPSGTLTGLQFDEQGFVVGTFSNGQSRNIGQVALADFEAADQLDRVGASMYAATMKAGERRNGRPGEAGFGAVAPGNLEQSTVDISQEFIRMMAAQRGFQANSKTITTADQLLSELIQLKRT
jgi:flagellar hook protein FlgE